jgi:membrane protease subunit (stomatin/prohibitin family)
MMKSAYEELGTNYQQAKTFDVLEGAAKNPGSMGADLMGAGLGITMGAGLAQSMNPMMQDAMKNVQGASMKVEANDDDQYAELKKLKSLLDEGIITQDDFDAKKAQILGL